MPHQPLPMRAVRYFLLEAALRILGAATAILEAMEALRKVRRSISMIVSPFLYWVRKIRFLLTQADIRMLPVISFNLAMQALKSSEKSEGFCDTTFCPLVVVVSLA